MGIKFFRLSLLFSLSFVFIILAGCAQKWSHPTATQAEFYQDNSQCTTQAQQAYFQSLSSTTAMNNQYVVPSSQRQLDKSFNYTNAAMIKQLFYRECMQAKGYSVSQDATSQEITSNQDSESQEIQNNAKQLQIDMQKAWEEQQKK